MENSITNLLSGRNIFDLFFKSFAIFFSAFYLLYSLIFLKQTQELNKSFTSTKSFWVFLLSLLQLIFGIILILLAIFVL